MWIVVHSTFPFDVARWLIVVRDGASGLLPFVCASTATEYREGMEPLAPYLLAVSFLLAVLRHPS